MKKLSLVLAAMIAASSISFYGTAAFAEETGLDYDGSVNVAFGNTTGSSSANSETGNPPSWIKDIYSTATPEPASTKDPNATPEPTKNPDATPEPTAAPTQKPSATRLLMMLEPEHRKLMLLRCQYCYIIIYRMILTAQMRYLLSHQEIFVCI